MRGAGGEAGAALRCTLDSMEREECVELIKSYGGKVTGGVSGKTSYLIADNDAGTVQRCSRPALPHAHARMRA